MTNFGYVLASKMLVENKLPVLFMYREEGTDKDSGWRFFSGLEDQDYVDNPENIAIYDIKTILSIDESVKSYLDSTSPAAYERTSSEENFKLVADFEFENEQ